MRAIIITLVFLASLAAAMELPYGSVPKGFTAEGVAQGMEKVKHLGYDKSQNIFMLNKTQTYAAPLTRREWLPLLYALSKDDRIGVSLGQNDRMITYGAISRRHSYAQDLFKADQLLGGVVFDRAEWLKGVALPNRYKPKRPKKRTIMTAAHFNVTGFQFSVSKKGVYTRTSVALQIMLIPTAAKPARDGGFLPDEKALAEGRLEPEDKANVDHIEANRAAYLKKPQLAKACQVAELAAFFRHLRESGIKLAELYKKVR